MIKRLAVAWMLTAFGPAAAQSLPPCTATGFVGQLEQSNCTVANPGGKSVVTQSFANSPTFVNTPVSQSVNQYRTTLIAVANGVTVFQQTFNAPFSDPSVQNAVLQAEGVLSSDGANFSSPALTSTSTGLQSSSLSYAPTSTTLDLTALISCVEFAASGTCSGVPVTNNVSDTVTFGPATIMIGPGLSDQFLVLAGQVDTNVNNSYTYSVTQNAVTTNTYLTTQTYVIQGTGGVTYSPCDINRDGKTNVTDVQGMIDEALGVSAAANDLNGDGVVNVVDVQIVMNGALNLDCSASGATPASVRVSERPAVRTIAIAAQRLAIAAPRLAITEVMNAASFRSGPISPGEAVTLTGTGLGPGVQVLFDGTPAPLTYVSATQINCVVPYEISGKGSSDIQVRYQGRTSSPFPLASAAANPALFTANGSGTGPAAALNRDLSYNSPTNPAAKGSTVVLFLTGEGQTSPPGVTGKVTTQSAVPPLTPQPILPVRVLIGGQTASIAFYGEAPGVVSGVMQLDVRIPSNVPPGDLPISVSAGGKRSQNGVTISVR